ncbi:MAG TPA: Phenylacetic acid catabolic protein [Longimicrobiales bacterium]|nr:Phenylacetic acid catabolic protein [Longimicrobiales bacterium]
MSTAVNEYPKAAALPEDVRGSVRDLVLVLADSKRVLGMRYGQWILGAPELEAGIACASMAQDEWGHARLLYALLRDFGEDVDAIEHDRSAGEYFSMDALDGEPASWPELVAVNALVDGALSVQLGALTGSAFLPLRQRVQKLIDEEAFHAAHGVAWFQRIARSGDEGREAMEQAAARILPLALRWFGPDAGRGRGLQEASLTDAGGSAMRNRFIERVSPLLRLTGIDTGAVDLEPDFSDFDEASRRSGGAPDERTIAQIRGDRNRAFLMD